MYLPRSLLISSHPVHEMPEYCIPYHTLSIELGYEAKEFNVNGRVHKDFVVGNVGICPANQMSTQAYGKYGTFGTSKLRVFLKKSCTKAKTGCITNLCFVSLTL